MSKATLHLGDCRDILGSIEGVDAIVTDPPYGMGRWSGGSKKWPLKSDIASNSRNSTDEEPTLWTPQRSSP